MGALADPTLGDWAAAAGALFTALAAGAALWTARQGRQVIEAAKLPFLEAQVTREPSGTLSLSIINSGAGLARGVNFAVHALGQMTDNVVGDGFLPAGDGAKVTTNIGLPAPPGVMRADLPDLAVMVAYRDASGFAHYRTHAGAEYVPRTLFRQPRYPDRIEVFKKLYPHVPIDSATRAANAIDKR